MAPADRRRSRRLAGLAAGVLLLAACDQASMPEFRSPIVFPEAAPQASNSRERVAPSRTATSRAATPGTSSAVGRPTIATTHVGGEAANLRAGPGTNHRVLGSAAPGVRLEVLGEQAGWLEIRNGQRTAWIAKGLTRQSTADAATPAERPPAPSTDTISDSGDVLPNF